MKRRWLSLAFRYTLALFALGILLFLTVFLLVYNGYYGRLPEIEDLQSIRQQESTKIFSSDGQLLGRYYLEDRSSVEIGEISPHVINCLVTIEDKRFYEHKGIDFRSLLRVAVKSILLRDASSGGGSTITQQLAKNLYPRVSHDYLFYTVNKLREMIIARRLEKIYTKAEIINLYLNTVSFGQDIYGIQSASERIFSKSATDLEIQEAATLVGMLKAVTYYNPLLNPDKSKERRDFILSQLVEANYISDSEYIVLKETALNTIPSNVRERNALYFLRQVEDEAREILEDISPGTSFRTAGLTVYTTLDSRMQKYAEDAMAEHLQTLKKAIDLQINNRFWTQHKNILDIELRKVNSYNASTDTARHMKVFNWGADEIRNLNTLDSIKYYLEFLQAGLLAIDPKTGQIKTWVGGLDPIHFPNDHVLSRRQVGSTFKPFIYASALEQQISPCEYFETEAVAYEVEGKEWVPQNSGLIEDEELTMATALERSVNTVTVKILQEAGIKNTIELARAAGIKSDIPAVPSIALGTASISLREMVESYGIFANQGWNLPSYIIEKIENRNGEVIYEYQAPPRNELLSRETGLMMTHFLKEVVNSGTGSELRSIYNVRNDIGGKTGTTQNNSDGWFIGISPHLVAGVWVGGEYPAISFNSSEYGQGARMALPVYAKFYQKLNNSNEFTALSKAYFPGLSPELQEKIDCDPIGAEFRLWEWLKNLGSGKRSKRGFEEADSLIEKPKLLDRIRGIFRKNKVGRDSLN